jgi:hypothetical protein
MCFGGESKFAHGTVCVMYKQMHEYWNKFGKITSAITARNQYLFDNIVTFNKLYFVHTCVAWVSSSDVVLVPYIDLISLTAKSVLEYKAFYSCWECFTPSTVLMSAGTSTQLSECEHRSDIARPPRLYAPVIVSRFLPPRLATLRNVVERGYYVSKRGTTCLKRKLWTCSKFAAFPTTYYNVATTL